jgi:hypothetical protein
VEHFPIGRRLAFDQDKGRLWVVCKSCERWNLTPMAERWEAIEECERLFRDTRLRMSTDQIGLARVSEGLELVRVGHPQRPEMAAWRYGDQFGRRRKRYIMMTGVGVVAAGALVSGYAALGLFAGGGSSLLNIAFQGYAAARNRKVIARIPTANGLVKIQQAHLKHARIVRSSDTDWGLSLRYSTKRPGRRMQPPWSYVPRQRGGGETLILTPHEALPALGALLPAVNGKGGNRRDVQSAVRLVEEAGNATRLMDNAAALAMRIGSNATTQGRLTKIPLDVRLALEMVTHEDDERRALEGELAVLEARWKEAEEIANISDNMFVPTAVGEWMRKLRG